MRKERATAEIQYIKADNRLSESSMNGRVSRFIFGVLNEIPYRCYFMCVLGVFLLTIYPAVARDTTNKVKSGVLEYVEDKYDKEFEWKGYAEESDRMYTRNCVVSDGEVEFLVVATYTRDGTTVYTDNYREILSKASSGAAS